VQYRLMGRDFKVEGRYQNMARGVPGCGVEDAFVFCVCKFK
jgi:hypothetical protein